MHRIKTAIFDQDLTSAALSDSFSDSERDIKIVSVMFHSDVAISETQQVSFNSANGVNYDTVLASNDLSAEQNYVFRPTGELVLGAGDALDVSCTADNTTGAMYVTVQYYTEWD